MPEDKKRGKTIDSTFDDKNDVNFEAILTEVLMRLASVEKLLLDKKIFTKEEFGKAVELNVEKFKIALNDQVKEFKSKKGLKN